MNEKEEQKNNQAEIEKPSEEKPQVKSSATFAEQVDAVLSGADTTSSHLEVLKVTPPLLRMVGVPNLPILMTSRHVKTITQESGSDSANYHGLDTRIVKRLPELISDPVMIMDSLTRDDSVVVVTQTVDKQNRPVIGAVKLNGFGNIDGYKISANILTSAYSKDNFQSFIERNIKYGSVLYADKEKSQELFEIPGIQFPDSLKSLDFNTIIRKTNAFVNSQEQKNSENTERKERSMQDDTNNTTAQSARERVQQIRDDMVKTLLEHIEKNPTDWQSGWNNIAAGAPYNGKTNTAYRGMNALYLAFLGVERGYKDTRWVTFNQAKELGASVKKGEKSSPIIFYELYDRQTKKSYDSKSVKGMTDEEKSAYLKENVYAAMKYSSVFNAEQCHNFPERKEIAMSEEERANQNAKIETIIANSVAPVRYDGGSRAYYSPGTDSIHLPEIKAFDSMQDYYATALHEIAHSTGHESRLNRDLSGGFGSESYAKEELRAELACVFMQMEQGIQLNGKHVINHAAYLNSWLEAAKNDTSVFFKAAADAQKIADYVADNYMQAADGAVIEEDNVAQEQLERNPMADYLKAESAKHEVEQRTVLQTRLDENIREWYSKVYPNDEAWQDIHPDITFGDLQEELDRMKNGLNNSHHIYGMLGEDSIIRERAFARLAELTNSTYESVYQAWLGESLEDKREREMAAAREDYPRDFEDEFTETLLDDAEAHVGTLNGEHKEETNSVPHYTLDFKLNYSNEMLLSNELKKLGFKADKDAYMRNEQRDSTAIENQTDRWVDELNYVGAEGKSIEGWYGKTFNGIMLESTIITGFTTSGLSLKEVQAVVDVVRDFDVDVIVKEIPSQHRTVLMQEQEQHEEKITLEEARNAMLDAQELRQNHYAVRIENVPYTDPEDGYESEEPAQVIYTISEHGTVREWKTIPLDSDVFYSDLPNGGIVSYEPVEYEELEEIAKKVREPIQTYKDVLRAEIEAGTERRRSEAYYDQRVDDILNEHYRTENGLFKRDIENPKYLSGMLYEEETRNGYKVLNITQDEEKRNIAIVQRKSDFMVAVGYNPDDGTWRQGYYDFEDQKAAEEFRAKNYPTSAKEETMQNAQVEKSAEKTIGEELANKSNWIKVNLPESAVGKQYGNNTLVKMPHGGEYQYFGLFVPSKFLHQKDGKWQLNVGDKLSYRLENDGRRVELTGQELANSFAGMTIGKTPERVAPSRAYSKVLDNIEKNVPNELRVQPNWCVYRTWKDENKDKKGKVIKSAVTGEGASSKNPSDWTDFDTAMKYARENNFEGLAFVIEKNSGITCIDLDKCVKNADTGEMKERAAKLIDELKGTYMERSTSGNGVHIFIKDDILKGGKYKDSSVNEQKGDLEVFDNQRIISMTGDMFSESNTLTRAGSSATLYLRQELGEKQQTHRPQSSDVRTGYKAGSDREVVERIRRSKRAGDFEDLYTGHGITGNASVDDMKLANILAFFTNGDAAQCMRIMREASTYRSDKPESYYNHTISKAIDTLTIRPSYGTASGASANNNAGRSGGTGATH